MNKEVSFESAKLLKEKGFGIDKKYQNCHIEKCYYDKNGDLIECEKQSGSLSLFEDKYSAPTIAEVVMWLYEKHGIWIVVNPHKGEDEDDSGKPFMEFDPEVWSFKYECIFHNTGLPYFNSPTEAYEAAFEYVLTNLI